MRGSTILMCITYSYITVCYENGVSKMMSDMPGPEDAEVSAITNSHPPLAPTRSNASVYSLASTQSPTGNTHS